MHCTARQNPCAQRAAPIMFIAIDGKLAGAIAVGDPIKETTPQALKDLPADGLRIVMLTAEARGTAEAVARNLGIDKVIAEVQPVDKARIVGNLRGDGPSFAMASVLMMHRRSRGPTWVLPWARALISPWRAHKYLSSKATSIGSFGHATCAAPPRETADETWGSRLATTRCESLIAAQIYPAFGLRLSPLLAAPAMSLSSVAVISDALRLRA